MRPEVLAEHVAGTIRRLFSPLELSVQTAGARLNGLDSVVKEVRDRLVWLEVRASIPGPQGPEGPPGRDGKDGRDGIDGKDGAPGLRYLGVHVAGKGYDVGDLVTAGGSAWYCARTTTGAPGTSPDWTLMVKRGRDRSARP